MDAVYPELAPRFIGKREKYRSLVNLDRLGEILKRKKKRKMKAESLAIRAKMMKKKRKELQQLLGELERQKLEKFGPYDVFIKEFI